MDILALDTRTDTILLEAAIEGCKAAIELIAVYRFNDMINCLEQDAPDVLLIGSGIILQEGVEKLLQIKSDDRYRTIPLVVLTEFIGEEKHLFEQNFCNTCFIGRPIDFYEIPAMLNRIIEFIEVCRQTATKEQQ